MILSLAAAGVALATAAGAGKFAWEFGLGGLPRPAQLWEKTLRLAALAKQRPQTGETPREFARRLRRDVPGATAAPDLASAYERSRFGQKRLDEDETERLESAWTSLRGALLRRVFRARSRRG